MNEKDKQKIADYVKEFYNKNPWINSRLWDDDCICESDEVISVNCPNKRCKDTISGNNQKRNKK